MVDFAFERLDPRLPGAVKWNVARHELSNYDSMLRNAPTPEAKRSVQMNAAEQGMTHAQRERDKALAQAIMQWAFKKHLVEEPSC